MVALRLGVHSEFWDRVLEEARFSVSETILLPTTGRMGQPMSQSRSWKPCKAKSEVKTDPKPASRPTFGVCSNYSSLYDLLGSSSMLTIWSWYFPVLYNHSSMWPTRNVYIEMILWAKHCGWQCSLPLIAFSLWYAILHEELEQLLSDHSFLLKYSPLSHSSLWTNPYWFRMIKTMFTEEQGYFETTS